MSGFSINSITVSGNLTRDPELRMIAGGTSVLNFDIAHNDSYKDSSGQWQKRANFFTVVVWAGLAESLSKQLSKGMLVVVSGVLQERTWEAQDGTKRRKVEIKADSVVCNTRGEAPVVESDDEYICGDDISF
jgi:single-strand DNA-binding protein